MRARGGRGPRALHLISIVEVFPGTPAAPSAQHVILQMYAGGQTVVGGAHLVVYDANNDELGRFTFTANVANGANQAKILVATAQAAAFWNVTPNVTITAILPAAGGKVCFEAAGFGAIDCVAWGTHPGSAAGGGQANVGPPFSPVIGLQPGRSGAAPPRRRTSPLGWHPPVRPECIWPPQTNLQSRAARPRAQPTGHRTGRRVRVSADRTLHGSQPTGYGRVVSDRLTYGWQPTGRRRGGSRPDAPIVRRPRWA